MKKLKKWKTPAALLLAFVMLLGCVSVCAEPWDGYVEGSDDGGVATVVDMGKLSNITGAGLSVSSKVHRSARYSGLWENHTTTGSIAFRSVPRDWSKYETLNLNIYSASACGSTFMIIISCDHVPNPGTSSSYFYYKVPINWTGWKTFELDLGSDFQQYNEANLAQVNNLQFNASGWSQTPSADAALYIDTITANISEASNVASANSLMDKAYPSKDKKTFRDTLGDGTALWLFSDNVYQNGETKAIDPSDNSMKATSKNGVAVIPAQVFTDSLGAELSQDGGNYALSYKGKKLSFKVGETAAKVGNTNVTLDVAPYLEGTMLYVPAVSTGNALGMNVGVFDQLIVFGSEDALNKFAADDYLAEVGGYMVCNRALDAETITAEDFEFARAKWEKVLVGDETNDMTNADIAQKVKNHANKAIAAQSVMKHDKDAAVLFGDKAITTSADMTTQYTYIGSMAYGWGTYGASTYHDPQLKNDILFALDWGYEHLYGDDEMKEQGWRSTSLYNWWDWYVGVGQELSETLLILRDEISPELRDKYLEPFHYIRKKMRTNKNLDCAQTRCREVTLVALLQDDVELMNECLYDFELQMRPTTANEGGYDDGSYINHGNLALAGSYGVDVQLRRVVEVASRLAGTKFESTSSHKYKQMFWMKNTYEPQMYDGHLMAMVEGRSPSGGTSAGYAVTVAALNLIGSFSDEDDLWLKQLIRRWADKNPPTVSVMSIAQIQQLQDILADDSIPDWEETGSARVYYNTDRAVSHQNGYAAGVAMSSERIANYESINAANTNGWYQGDGVLYIYREGETGDQFGGTFWNNVNPYHLPGTTEDTQERKATSYREEFTPDRSFVGGVSIDGKHAVAAMDFEAFHNDVPPSTTGQSENNDWDIHNNDLTAKKSWFMFDNEVVALGAGINSTTGFDVQTTVENHILKNNVRPVSTGGDDIVEYTPVGVMAIGSDGNVPENVADNNYETRWSYEGTSNAWLTLDLGEAKQVGYVAISQYGGTGGKQAIFRLELSNDGENWTQVFDGKASGQTDQLEAYDCKNTTARYVRYVGSGRTTGSWNSITEFKVFAPREDGQMRIPGDGKDGTIYGAEKITVNGSEIVNTGDVSETVQKANWVSVENLGGYYFPKGGTLSISKTNKQNAFVELWLEHGKNPKNATYAYAVLPNYSESETAAYAANPDIEILSNTAKVQAVRDTSTGLTGIVFWEAGSFGGITVSKPMTVLVRDTADGYAIAVSDPSQKLGSEAETVRINQVLTLENADKGLNVQTAETETVITVQFEQEAAAGKTYQANFAASGTAVTPTAPSGGNHTAGGGGGGAAATTPETGDETPAPTTTFADMKEAEWATEYVAALAEQGIVSGDENGNFRPNDSITREEFVKLLVGALGIEVGEATESFSDVDQGAWYAPYLAAAKAAGITTGNADGTFGVGAEITRQDMAVMANRALETIGVTLEDGETTFDDNADIADYAMTAIGKMQQAGILSGNGNGGFAPLDSASRAQAAKVIVGLMNQIPTAEVA